MKSPMAIQQRLYQLGFDPGPIDGVIGPRTEAAIVEFKKSRGLRARPYIGPLTLEALFGEASGAQYAPDVPWMNEAAKHLGLHERTHNSILSAFLKSDGKALGDPAKLPWCGDFVDTCIARTLPDEPRPGPLGRNPYLARNWMHLGEESPPAFGAVVVFWRGRPSGHSGHVGFAAGYDARRGRILVRGGNQSNSVSDAWLGEDRLLGYRKPVTHGRALPALPGHDSAGATLSRNEA